MVNPYEQGRLLLSFVDERRSRRAKKLVSPATNLSLIQRVLIANGSALITLGTRLMEYRQYEHHQPTVSTMLEAK